MIAELPSNPTVNLVNEKINVLIRAVNALQTVEAQPQADNISRDAMSRLKEPPMRSDDTRHPY